MYMSNTTMSASTTVSSGLLPEDDGTYAAFLDGQHPAEVAAAEWFLQCEEGLDAQQETAFHAWLTASPAHQQAYEAMSSLMGRVADMPVAAVHRLEQPSEHVQATHKIIPSRKKTWHLRWLAPSLLSLAAVITGVHLLADHALWQGAPTFEHTYATARAEQKNITLPDGSALMLDSSTTAAVSFTDTQRHVTLPEGQVYFQVASKDNMPFEVAAGKARITVVGTKFSVRYTQDGVSPDKTHIAVEEGHVRVAKKSWWPWQQTTDLRAGDAVTVSADGDIEPVLHTASLPSGLLWREGRVNFSNTRLSEALSEFERYGDTNAVIVDPVVAQMRIQGSFDLQRADAFLRALPQVLPVYLKEVGHTTEIVRAVEVKLK
jgi:transmembrane sensor